jgi:hypothetical protein
MIGRDQLFHAIRLTKLSLDSSISGFYGRPRSSSVALTTGVFYGLRARLDGQICEQFPFDAVAAGRLSAFARVDRRELQWWILALLADRRTHLDAEVFYFARRFAGLAFIGAHSDAM